MSSIKRCSRKTPGYPEIMTTGSTIGSSDYTVLYIEDDEANRTLVQFIFARCNNITLLQAETGSEGIKLAIQKLPHIILLDLSLPDASGFDVLKDLKNGAETAHIPVIALTGENSPQDIAKGIEAGFFGYLTKPIDVTSFYDMIDKTIQSLSSS